MTRHADSPATLSTRPLQRGLHTYWRFSRGLTMGVRGAVISPERGVFLVRHTYVPGWYLPGGGVEAGETTLQALDRELHEEARISVAAQPVLHGVFFNDKVSRRDHVLVYVVRDFRVTEVKRPDREIAEAGFFPLGSLPDDTSPATRRRLDEITAGSAPPPTW